MKCCPDYCESCKEHHPPESLCPPYEVRTTGITWLWQRLDHLDEVLATAQAENRLLQSAVVEALNKCGQAIEQRDSSRELVSLLQDRIDELGPPLPPTTCPALPLEDADE